MRDIINKYIETLNSDYANATEHTYRPALKTLVETLCPYIEAINEPKRKDYGALDFEIKRKENGVDVGYIETKDIGDTDLRGEKKNKAQFDRYKRKIANLIFTDYLNFYFYHNDELAASVKIGEIENGKIRFVTENADRFCGLIQDFCAYELEITNAHDLARRMANVARELARAIQESIDYDEREGKQSSLRAQMQVFREMLMPDIKTATFADLYAQTISYGLFVARCYDEQEVHEPFTRYKAERLIPKTNPFLRKFFGYIASQDIDLRIGLDVHLLADILRCCNPFEIIKNYQSATHSEEPIIHFYETFLAAYNPEERKNRGVWYTPKPVVQFIVGAVDEVLKTDFNLREGLADTSKINKNEKPYHKVQMLDPATGSGTFLAELVRHIHKQYETQQGMWNSYVAAHLIPRLHGFELLMASYAIAHINMDLLLTETKFTGARDALGRFRIYLTDSLENAHEQVRHIPFAEWLSDEAMGAQSIKQEMPIMVVIGNPPYSGISQNYGKWIIDLIEDYKYVDGVYFEEKKHWLHDDYVKFIRYGQYFVEKNGSGIVAYINPHGYLDNPSFRGMRWNLLHTYDKIYTIDLHGNTRKKERVPDDTKDENVFDIMQGVSINLFIKSGKKKQHELAEVFHFDLYGTRAHKFHFLENHTLSKVKFKKLKPQKPNFLFVPKNTKGQKIYKKGFALNELLMKNVTGMVSMGDSFIYDENKNELKNRLDHFVNNEITKEALTKQFKLGKNYADFIINNKSKIVLDDTKFIKISYRPFDDRYTYFDNKLVWRWRYNVLQHFLNGYNVGVVFKRGHDEVNAAPVMLTNALIDYRSWSRPGMQGGDYVAPLYIYPNEKEKSLKTKIPNLKEEIVKKIATCAKMLYKEERAQNLNTLKNPPPPEHFSPLDLLDYIYGVLHSPAYRARYAEFLKTDFPRVPYPSDAPTFWRWAQWGERLRLLHLMQSLPERTTTFPEVGDNRVEKPHYKAGRVYINATQYVGGVSERAWNFYIGGYQPAQKWLKDRRERVLTYDDLQHYQNIIAVLETTAEVMDEMGEVLPLGV